jgi:hypothetical protein
LSFPSTIALSVSTGLIARGAVLVDAHALVVDDFTALALPEHAPERAGRVFALELRAQRGAVVSLQQTLIVVYKFEITNEVMQISERSFC